MIPYFQVQSISRRSQVLSTTNLGFRRSSRSSFTLVEIVIAIAIFGFAILCIFGLLNVALTTSGNSQRESSEASIVRTLGVDIRSVTSASSITSLTNGPLYYDIVARPVASGSSSTFFKVNLTLTTSAIVQSLLPLHNTSTNLYLWSAQIAYPPPTYPHSTVVLLDNASY